MLDDASGNPPGTDPGTRGHGTWGEDPFAVAFGDISSRTTIPTTGQDPFSMTKTR